MTSPLPDNAVRVTGLSKKFPNGPLALDQVDLAVPKGQLLSLIGLSGSGKSTLLRHLNGLIPPSSGFVEVLGTNVVAAGRRELRELRRDVGFVFQSFGLVGRLTALENVLSGALGRLSGPRFGTLMYPKALRREALENLDRVGLGDRAFQRSDTLSGGQQQRVAIARALVNQPSIILADEPTGNLDSRSGAEIMRIFQELNEDRGITIIFVTHEPEIAEHTRRIVRLHDGRVVGDSPVRFPRRAGERAYTRGARDLMENGADPAFSGVSTADTPLEIGRENHE